MINGLATLGGGNHFIEFSKSSETGKYWCVIHSGSKYLGKKIAEYWQEQAVENTRSNKVRDSLRELIISKEDEKIKKVTIEEDGVVCYIYREEGALGNGAGWNSGISCIPENRVEG